MEIVTLLSLSITAGYVGFIFGSSMKQIETSERSITEAFKEGYIKGYFDGHANATKKKSPTMRTFQRWVQTSLSYYDQSFS
jgi:hypothetical protein